MRRARYRWCRDGKEMAAGSVWMADSWMLRARGLLGRVKLAPDEAMHIAPCNSIHCFFMAYAIDAIFLDARGNVVQLSPNVAPWRLRFCWSGASVVELLSGEIARIGLGLGDSFEVDDSSNASANT